MRERHNPSGHVDIASNLNNVGSILYTQGKYDDALDYYQRALEMRERNNPSGRLEIASSLK
jgi:Tfp pilus assembly protein PilF